MSRRSVFYSFEPVDRFEVQVWLEKNLELSPYQKELISSYGKDKLRSAPFYFYKQKKYQSSFFWRLSILIWPVYLLFLYLCLPFAFLVNGTWGYGRNFINKYFEPWKTKIGL